MVYTAGKKLVYSNQFDLLATDPVATQVEGDLYYNSTSNVFRFYNGTIWQDFGGTSTSDLINLNKVITTDFTTSASFVLGEDFSYDTAKDQVYVAGGAEYDSFFTRLVIFSFTNPVGGSWTQPDTIIGSGLAEWTGGGNGDSLSKIVSLSAQQGYIQIRDDDGASGPVEFVRCWWSGMDFKTYGSSNIVTFRTWLMTTGYLGSNTSSDGSQTFSVSNNDGSGAIAIISHSQSNQAGDDSFNYYDFKLVFNKSAETVDVWYTLTAGADATLQTAGIDISSLTTWSLRLDASSSDVTNSSVLLNDLYVEADGLTRVGTISSTSLATPLSNNWEYAALLSPIDQDLTELVSYQYKLKINGSSLTNVNYATNTDFTAFPGNTAEWALEITTEDGKKISLSSAYIFGKEV